MRNILLGGGILLGLYFLFKGQWPPQWPPANGGNGTPPPTEPAEGTHWYDPFPMKTPDGQVFWDYASWEYYMTNTLGIQLQRRQLEWYGKVSIFSIEVRTLGIPGIGKRFFYEASNIPVEIYSYDLMLLKQKIDEYLNQ